MGCKCGNQNLDKDTEYKPEVIYSNKNDNINFNTIESDIYKKQEEYMKKYSDYPSEIVYIINKIRQNPNDYAEIIEDSIKNIIEEENESDPDKPKIIYKNEIKVALTRGEPAFREAAEELRNMSPIPPLEFKEEICIPLPDNEEQIKDANYLKEKVREILSRNEHINAFFKEMVKIPKVSALLMIVDDSGKSAGKKRKVVLNKNFKYIGVSYKFIGKTFISYFSFSK